MNQPRYLEDRSFRELLDDTLDAFHYDPPDTDFQRGYLAAIEWVDEVLRAGADELRGEETVQ